MIGRRHRKAFGDINALAESIERLGLLQPVVLTPENKLVAGYRRIKAFQQLGRETIPTVVAKTLADASALLQAERDENTCREDFVPSEAVSIGEAIAKAYKPKAKEAQRKHGGTAPGKKSLTQKKGKCSERHAHAGHHRPQGHTRRPKPPRGDPGDGGRSRQDRTPQAGFWQAGKNSCRP